MVNKTLEDIMAEATARRAGWSPPMRAWMGARSRVRSARRKVSRFPREVRWFIQRGRRGWSDRDTWSMDYHIARVNAEMLLHLRDHTHGCPSVLVGDDGDVGAAAAVWANMLTEMAAGWRSSIQYVNDMDTTERDKFVAMMPTYTKFFHDLWD